MILDHLRDLAGDFAKEIQGDEVLSNKSRLFINNGDETFSDQSKNYNIARALYAMGANCGDIDNDGFLDFFTARILRSKP